MTKASDKAAAILERKEIAYCTKVETLTGHLWRSRGEIRSQARVAFHTGTTTAEEFAVSVAIKEPVGAAVHALKAMAVEAADQRARKHIERVTAELAEAGGTITYPRGDVWSQAYREAKRIYDRFSDLVTTAPGTHHMHINQPRAVIMSDTACERFVKMARESAAAEYDAFICKLSAKVGEVTDATLTGNHVWGESVLTVTTATGERQNWRTHQIWNVSKLGLEFPQWPTRLMKGGRV